MSDNKKVVKESRELSTLEKIAQIEETCGLVIESPESNLSNLSLLFKFLTDDSFEIIKICSLSLVEIFKDIVPLYRLDKEEIETKLKEVISKQERKVLAFEYDLLNYYKKFLQTISQIRHSLSELTRGQQPPRVGQGLRGGLRDVSHPVVLKTILLQLRGPCP